MRFFEQKLPGVFIIEPEPFQDDRGMFRRNFCVEEYKKAGIVTDIKQCNVSENNYKHTLRGFHYQLPPHGEGKTMSCFKGAIYDIIVDLRPDSPTYLEWISLELNDRNRKTIHVPPGCANAFLTLEDNSLIFYYCSEKFTPQAERGIRYNDPLFKFNWPFEPKVISEKDKNHPDFVPGKGKGKK
jgi:dTDP-4-dehydrorhamnose 3,5-epimerase